MSVPAEIRAVARITSALAGTGSLAGSYLLDDLDQHLVELAAEAEFLVEEHTGFAATGSRALVLTRREWAAENVDSMLTLLGPILDRVDQRVGGGTAGELARLAYRPALGAQLGAILGLLSHRVLGQYDVISEEDPPVWFVGVNLVATERRFGFVPRDFRLWVAIHELTHRAQFRSNPWLRRHFLDSVGDLLAAPPEPRALFDRIVSLLREPSTGEPLAVRLLGSGQLDKIHRLQAFMTLIEGHASWAMDKAGRAAIPTLDRIRRTLEAGAVNANPLVKLLYRLIGLEMKKRQYVEGEAFLRKIEAAAGLEGVKAGFRSPETLPSPEEIRGPRAWMERVL